MKFALSSEDKKNPDKWHSPFLKADLMDEDDYCKQINSNGLYGDSQELKICTEDRSQFKPTHKKAMQNHSPNKVA